MKGPLLTDIAPYRSNVIDIVMPNHKVHKCNEVHYNDPDSIYQYTGGPWATVEDGWNEECYHQEKQKDRKNWVWNPIDCHYGMQVHAPELSDEGKACNECSLALEVTNTCISFFQDRLHPQASYMRVSSC